MDKHQILRECAENLALLTQLGLSVVVPPLLCLYRGVKNSKGIFRVVMAIALLLGMGGAAVNVWRTWKMIERRGEKQHRE